MGACATEAGTEGYKERHRGKVPAEHFRSSRDLWMSSIGLGSYLGDIDEETDERLRAAVFRCVEAGVNVLDTAISYRIQRAERTIGRAIVELLAAGKVTREELIVCSKAGYLTYEAEIPRNGPAYFQTAYYGPGILRPEQVVGGIHSLAPRFLEDQLERSRKNLCVETIDFYFLHNPETQLREIDMATFLSRLEAAFQCLEQAARDGKIQWYGTAGWDAFRKPVNQPGYLSLTQVLGMARRVGGDQHHFRAVQVPLSLMMPEAFAVANQIVEGDSLTLVDAAKELGLTLMAASSLGQGELGGPEAEKLMKPKIPGLDTHAQKSLQFVRSIPGVSTALVGLKLRRHVDETLALVAKPPMHAAELRKYYKF
ncbi:MAG: aldo/keto reductase [Planctomycetes bacterium]|nr:aldo/keto reductase [Planctomycetota bacterium]